MKWIVHLKSCVLLVGIICNSIFLAGSEKERRCCKDYMLISTVDGSITALDLNSGLQCWSVILDPEKFVSSSLSKLEFYENGRRVSLVPSLDGSVYKYDAFKKIITPLPINVDILINHSGYLDPANTINGGKIKIIHGIHRSTGEVIYTCNVSGCINFKTPFPKNMLIIEEVIQSVNSIDSGKAEKRWHFRVVELQIKIASSQNLSAFSNATNETALISHVPPNVKDFINVELYKISLQNGFAGMINKTINGFSWMFKAPSPINDAWIVIDDLIQLLDPFDKDSGFYSVDVDDGQYSALLFLGIYEKQNYIKRSRKLQLKQSGVNSLAQNLMHHTVVLPVCLSENTVSKPHLGLNVTDMMSEYGELTVSDHGFYFYANISITENATHCIMDSTYIVTYQNEFPIRVWLVVILLSAPATLWLSFAFIRKIKEKSFADKSTCSVAVSSNADSVNLNEEFKSRFHQDFELISILGKGGFGVVMDVKNRIDDCRYAVKRICLREELNNFQYQKVLREVKALAKLDHHGIVRYFNAWLEYPPPGWQEKKDKEANICDISNSTSDDDETGSNFISSNSIKVPSHNFTKCKSAKPIVLEKLNQNPLQLFNNDPFFDNISFEESKLSAYSSSDVIDSSAIRSDENSNNDHSKKNKIYFEYTDDANGSDSFIHFENDLNFSNPKGDQFTENYSTDDSDSASERNYSGKFWKNTKCIRDTDDYDSFIQFENDDDQCFGESAGEKSDADKFLESSHSKNNLSSNKCHKLSPSVSKKHLTCYESLKIINESLVYPLKFEEFDVFISFVFCDTTSTKSIVDTSKWKNIASSFTREKLRFYQTWLICILCSIQLSKTFACGIAKNNFCSILYDISDRLDKNKNMTFLNDASAQSSKPNAVQLPLRNKFPASSKLQDTKLTINFNKKTPMNFTKGYLYIQMQLCQKESLRDWLTEHSDWRDYSKVMEIFLEIVDAVHYVHSCGLMHRDLKPSNIYFSMEGAIKIGDFGLATSSEIKAENGSSFQPSDIHTSDIGTELYMSPEQKLNQDYDSKTDIYSLGIILFELLVPFKTSSERCKVLLQVRKFEFPEEFRNNFKDESQLVELLLDDDPKGRPTTSEIKQHPVLVKFMSSTK